MRSRDEYSGCSRLPITCSIMVLNMHKTLEERCITGEPGGRGDLRWGLRALAWLGCQEFEVGLATLASCQGDSIQISRKNFIW